MGEFNSDDHYIYYCGQESLRRNGETILVNKTVQNAVLGYNLKNDRMISVHFQGKPFKITVIQIYAPVCWRSWSWTVLWRPTRPFRTNTQKDVLFILGDWNAKVGSPETPGVTSKFGLGMRNEAGQRKCTGHSKHPLPRTREKTLHMDITRWSTPKSDCILPVFLKMPP